MAALHAAKAKPKGPIAKGLLIAVALAIPLGIAFSVLQPNRSIAGPLPMESVILCDVASGIHHDKPVRFDGVSMSLRGKVTLDTTDNGGALIKVYQLGKLHYSCQIEQVKQKDQE